MNKLYHYNKKSFVFIISVFILLTYLLLPSFINLNTFAYDCDFNDFTLDTGGELDPVPGEKNKFYYKETVDKTKFKFIFNTSRIEWRNDSTLATYKNPQDFIFNITFSPGFDDHYDFSKISGTQDAQGYYTQISYSGDDNFGHYDSTVRTVTLKGKAGQELCQGTYETVPQLKCGPISVSADNPDQTTLRNWTVNVKNISINSHSQATDKINFILSGNIIEPQTCRGGGRGGQNCSHATIPDLSSYTYSLGKLNPGPPPYNIQAVSYPDNLPMCGPVSFEVYPVDDLICGQSPCKTPRGDGREDDYHCTDSVCQSCSYCRLNPTTTPTPIPRPTDNPILCRDCQANHDCSGLCGTCLFCNPPTPVLSYTPIPPLPDLTPLCDQVDIKYQGDCHKCVDPPKSGMWTAIGCLPVGGLEVFLKDYLFTFGIGIAGGIAFLYFIYGSFLFLTSAGNAETVGQAKEIIISAVSGLIFILLSIFFLKIIGADILRIPGFS